MEFGISTDIWNDAHKRMIYYSSLVKKCPLWIVRPSPSFALIPAEKKKKIIQKSPHITARFIALSPDPIPSLAVLHNEKQAFQCAALQSWELCLRIRL